jgi:hypothetical protein
VRRRDGGLFTVDAGASGVTDASDADAAADDPLDEVVADVLDDIDAAYDDYERGYTDADATLAVVMNHVERLRDGAE